MKKIKDLIIVSDMDGTIIPISGIVSERNLEAIERFRALGGAFAVATGRSPVSAKNYLELFKINNYVIANNGALIYNLKENRVEWGKALDSSYKAVVKLIHLIFPNVGIIAITLDDVYHVAQTTKYVEKTMKKQPFKFVNSDCENLPDGCSKVLFLVEPDEISAVSALANEKCSEFEYIVSSEYCFEMMSKNITKGYPLERFVALFGKTLDNTVAVGDYYNDIDMIKKAFLGVAVGNALDDVKKAADMIVGSCEEDGLAELIDYLIDNSDIN